MRIEASSLTESPEDFIFFQDGGEMGQLMRNKNWNDHPMGSPAMWPKSLQTLLGVILHTKFPMFIWWGPELFCFYNDAYRPSLGNNGKHPHILGMPAKKAWTEIWDIISPLIHQVLDGGEGTWSEDQLVPIFRNGQIEDVYWTFSYSRIINDEGKAFGVLVTCVETTEKVINQRKLAESNELLEFATEAAELGTWDYNPKTGTFHANKKLKEWFGLLNEKETDLTKAINIIAEKDRNRVVEAIEESLRYDVQKPYDIEYSIIHPQTLKEIVVAVKGKCFFDEQGQPYRFSGTMEDITEKNTAKRIREESEQNLRNIVEQAPVAMCVLKGPEHRVEIANEKMIRLWGKSRQEVIKRPIFEGLPEARDQGLEELLNQVFLSGQRFVAQERAVELPRGKKLESVYQNFVYEPLIGNNGEIQGVIAITLDVTEQVMARRKIEDAEERARLAIAGGNLGTFDFDIKTKTSITSVRFHEIFNAPIGANHEEILACIYPEDRKVRDSAINEAINTGKIFYEVRVLNKDKNLQWVRIEGIVLKDDSDEPIRMLGTALDVTDQKELEQKREEYIAIASHELKNPLTSLKLNLDVLSEQSKESRYNNLIEKSRKQVNRLISLTNELLNVSKISAGALDLKKEIFSLQDCINESIATVQAETHKNKFNVFGYPDISLVGDRFRIEQVLINLLSNASKYSPEGSSIDINVTQSKNDIRIEVKDSGIGIEPDKLQTVFQKFSRLQSNDIVEGHGLGLYISEQIIRKHGGKIGVVSEKGHGSTFWITLPR